MNEVAKATKVQTLGSANVRYFHKRHGPHLLVALVLVFIAAATIYSCTYRKDTIYISVPRELLSLPIPVLPIDTPYEAISHASHSGPIHDWIVRNLVDERYTSWVASAYSKESEYGPAWEVWLDSNDSRIPSYSCSVVFSLEGSLISSKGCRYNK